MSATRATVGAVGVLVGLYGAYLLLTREGSTSGLVSAVIWLAGGVVLHDFVFAPVVLGLMFLGARAVPSFVRRAATVGVVVLGTATVFAVPVLGRFGARPDNPTLLDRHYLLGWVVLAVLVLAAVAVGAVRERSRSVPARREGSEVDPDRP